MVNRGKSKQVRVDPVQAITRGKACLWAALVIMATLCAYLPALQAGFVWDDDLYVTHNDTLRTFDGLRRIWFEIGAVPQYYPLVYTTFWIEYHLWGLAPSGYHLVNICLHAAAALLLALLLHRLLVPGAWFAAAVFALHPVHVESVAWITERKNVLSTVLFLCAALCLVRFFKLDDAGEQRREPWRLYALGAALFCCALLSKTVTISLPAALVLIWWWKERRWTLRAVAFLTPLFIMGALLGSVTAWTERHVVQAEGAAWKLTAIERCLVAGRALWFYAGKLLLPWKLTFIYPRWQIDSGAAWQYLFPLAVLGMVATLWGLRGRLGRGPLVAVLFFAGTLVPTLGFFDVFSMQYSFVEDHFQYLASIGLIALAAALATLAARRLSGGAPALRTVGMTALLLALGILTFRQAEAYKDEEALWRDTLAKNPGAWMAHTNLGVILQARAGEENVLEAMDHFRESLRLKPDQVEPRLDLGELLMKSGKTDEAVAVISEAVRLKPDNAIARYNLGTALAKQGKLTEALSQFNEAIRLWPDLPTARFNLATTLMKLGRYEESAAAYQEILRRWPGHADAHNNLAYVLVKLGRREEAEPHRISALRLKAWALATQEDPKDRNGAEAVRLAERACEQTGYKEPLALDTLAAAFAESGRFDEALAMGARAVEAAKSAGNTGLVAEIGARMELYRSHRPYRDSSLMRRFGEVPQN